MKLIIKGYVGIDFKLSDLKSRGPYGDFDVMDLWIAIDDRKISDVSAFGRPITITIEDEPLGNS